MIFWLVVSGIYYFLGWILFIYYYSDFYSEEWAVGSFFGSLFGLWFLWFIPYALKNFKGNKPKMNFEKLFNKYKIIVENHKKSNEQGIIFYTDYDGNAYVYYNFPEEDYCAMIEINTKIINSKTVEKIISKLKKWADNENRKNVRIRVYKNLSL
jgi:hypothetical protein